MWNDRINGHFVSVLTVKSVRLRVLVVIKSSKFLASTRLDSFYQHRSYELNRSRMLPHCHHRTSRRVAWRAQRRAFARVACACTTARIQYAGLCIIWSSHGRSFSRLYTRFRESTCDLVRYDLVLSLVISCRRRRPPAAPSLVTTAALHLPTPSSPPPTPSPPPAPSLLAALAG